MNIIYLFPKSAAPARSDPSPDRPKAIARIAGETDSERNERHLRALKRMTEICLNEAARLERQAQVQVLQPRVVKESASAVERADAELLLVLDRLERIAQLNKRGRSRDRPRFR